MAFGTTATITVNAVAKVLNRINQDNYGSEYFLRTTTESYRMKIRHSKMSPEKSGIVRDQHNIEVTHTVFGIAGAADTVRQSYIVTRLAENDDVTQAGYVLAGFVDYIDSATVQGDTLAWMS